MKANAKTVEEVINNLRKEAKYIIYMVSSRLNGVIQRWNSSIKELKIYVSNAQYETEAHTNAVVRDVSITETHLKWNGRVPCNIATSSAVKEQLVQPANIRQKEIIAKTKLLRCSIEYW